MTTWIAAPPEPTVCPDVAADPETCCWPLCERDAVRDHQTTSPGGTTFAHRRCTEHPRILR